VALLVALFWMLGAASPDHPRPWSSQDLRWHYYYIYEAFYGALLTAPMLWNPWQLCGMPWLGTLQGGFFYPPHVLYLVLPTYHALALSTVLHLAFAAATTAAFARHAGLSTAAATLAALIFTLAGPVRDFQLWPALLEAASWLPLGAIAVLEIARGSARRGVLILGAASGASWLAGFPQATILAIYAWAGILLALDVQARAGWRTLLLHAGTFIVALACGVCLGAVALFPGLELARNAVRSTSALRQELLYQFGVPKPQGTLIAWTASARFLIGLAAVLAPLACIDRTHRRLALTIGVLGLAAGAIALGPGTPMFALYSRLPGIGWFRSPHRVLIVSQFYLALVAAIGSEGIFRRLGGTRGAVGLTAVAALALVNGLAVGAPVPRLPYDAAARPWDPALLRAYSALAKEAGPDRVWPLSPVITGVALPPKLPTLSGLRSVEDYEPLTLKRQGEYFEFFLEGRTQPAQPQDPFNGRIISLAATPGRYAPAARQRLLDLAAVRFVLLPSRLQREDVRSFVRDAALRPPRQLTPDVSLFENPHSLPRAFVTYQVHRAPPPDELLQRIARPDFDPLTEAYVESDSAYPSGVDPPRGHTATIVQDTPQTVEIEAHLLAPGLVVLADTYYPGWVATIDGAPAPILATNHLFRGVPTPTGTHRIRFAYRPRALLLGAVLTLLTAILLAAAWSRLEPRPAA
jgi:hypothetical protein